MATSDSPLSIDASRTLQITVSDAPDVDEPDALITDLSTLSTPILKSKNIQPLIMTGPIVNEGYRPNDPESGPLAVTGFESGDFNETNYSPSGERLFQWGNGVNIVTMSPAGNPQYVNKKGDPSTEELVGDPRDWTAKTGNNSMQYLYPPGQNWVETRFAIKTRGLKDAWYSWWMKIPENYYHSDNTNNKLFATWQRVYSNQYQEEAGLLQVRPSGTDGSAYFYINDGSGKLPDQDFPDFCDVTKHLGKWMKLIFNVRCESSPGSGDGVRQCFQQWEDEAEPRLVLYENRPIADLGGQTQGYMLGYANATFIEETVFLIDDFTVSGTPLVGN